AEDGIRDFHVTGVQTCALPISPRTSASRRKIAWASAGSCCWKVTGRFSTSTRPNRLTCSYATTQPRFFDQCASRQLVRSRCAARSEERRVGKECRARGGQDRAG